MEVEEKDPVQLNCTTSSSCRRSCVQIFILLQLIIIFILSLCLRSLRTSTQYKDSDNAVENISNGSWTRTDGKMEKLNENPIYSKFNISRKSYKPKVNLLLIVSSAPKRRDRRDAIRETWWQDCSSEKVKVKCIFMTDWKENSTSLIEEQSTYNDTEFQNLQGGVEFGKRFLYHMVWAMQNYEFDYFMRIDDDYFLCLKRFLYEIPLPMVKQYHWGYVHCIESLVRPEESIIMFSRDLVETFLGQDPSKMLCHPWADQMIATWVNDLKLDTLYNNDKRIHHDPPVSHIDNFVSKLKDVCRLYIGLHGSYPATTRKLWSLRGREDNLEVTLDEFTTKCDKPQVFNWEGFVDEWRYKPKLCVKDPKWDTYLQEKGNGVYFGRQGN